MPAVLSPSSVLLLSCGFSASYLSPIYLVPSARIRLPSPSTSNTTSKDDPADIATPSKERRDRNHPSVIKSRLIAVSLSSLSSLLSIPDILSKSALPTTTTFTTYKASISRALQLLGFVLPSSLSETLKLLVFPLGLTASLFAGSLYIQYLEGDLPLQRKGGSWKSLKERFDSWRGIRNFVIVRLFSLSHVCETVIGPG